MKNMDYAAMGAAFVAYGAASSAYSEASRAQAGVNQLWKEIQLIRNDINSQKYEREFQRWAEELMYQFSKTVTFISDSPGNPINDCADLFSFLGIIEENNLDTSLISGFENKERFEKILLEAQKLLNRLEKTSEVQDYLRQREAGRLERDRKENEIRHERERLRAEKAAKEAAAAKRDTIIVWSILSLSVLFFVICMFVDFMPGVFVSIVGVVFAIYAVSKR